MCLVVGSLFDFPLSKREEIGPIEGTCFLSLFLSVSFFTSGLGGYVSINDEDTQEINVCI